MSRQSHRDAQGSTVGPFGRPLANVLAHAEFSGKKYLLTNFGARNKKQMIFSQAIIFVQRDASKIPVRLFRC
jgi:hypothetical protein